MASVRSIYKIGIGPSSSHSMGPRSAAQIFKDQLVDYNVDKIVVELYGSLAATGKGHLTDLAILEGLKPYAVELIWQPEIFLPIHSNGMNFKAFSNDELLREWQVYSVGGGTLYDEGNLVEQSDDSLSYESMSEILSSCEATQIGFDSYVFGREGDGLTGHLEAVWQVMKNAIKRGMETEEEFLPGPLNLRRKARSFNGQIEDNTAICKDLIAISSYALAVAEENACGGEIVTAPTCGSCGVLPSVLLYLQVKYDLTDQKILQALAVAGLFGAIVAQRASISGAEVGCQGEIGTACAMAAAAAAYLTDGKPRQVEYAAEMGMEHFLGLTCDPVKGLVQVPCIERNAFAAMRAFECATYAISTDGEHLISFDDVVDVMNNTGRDLQEQYRETALGGLASRYCISKMKQSSK